MNEKVKNVAENIDKTAEKCNSFISNDFDKYLAFLKGKGDGIPAFIDRIASRFSVIAMTVCGLLYTVLCLKNMVFSLFFKDAPTKLCLSYAIGSVIALAICVYAGAKMMDVLPKVINSSSCKISSLNIFSVFTAISLLLTVGSLLGGIYLAIEAKAIQPFFYGLGGAAFFALITIYNANPEKFGIVADEQASAGEDFVSIATFALKVMLRLVPIAMLILPIIGICEIIPPIFTSYITSYQNSNIFLADLMVGEMSENALFVFIGIVPLLVYLNYIFNYVVLDLIRAILQLPNKLDALKK